MYVCVSVSTSVHLTVRSSNMTICLSFCLSVLLSGCPSDRPFVCLSGCMFVCLCVPSCLICSSIHPYVSVRPTYTHAHTHKLSDRQADIETDIQTEKTGGRPCLLAIFCQKSSQQSKKYLKSSYSIFSSLNMQFSEIQVATSAYSWVRTNGRTARQKYRHKQGQINGQGGRTARRMEVETDRQTDLYLYSHAFIHLHSLEIAIRK